MNRCRPNLRGGGGRVLALALLAALACTTTPQSDETASRDDEHARSNELGVADEFDYAPLDPGEVRVQPEGLTVEQSWLLDLYTLFHARDYTVSRVLFPGSDGDTAVAYLARPPGEGPFATVVVYPILDGSHVVSEALSKALVHRGYAVARLERKKLDLEDPQTTLADLRLALRGAVIDGRRLVDWLITRDDVDPERIASAGVSIGAIQALLLDAADPRVRGGFYVMVGGGLAEILWESRERPVRAFRDSLSQTLELYSREDFVLAAQPETRPVDPLTWADQLEPSTVLMASGRFDRVIQPERSRDLWEALGRPRWIQLPSGHYQLFPFFWWTAARGADHLDRLFAEEGVTRVTSSDRDIADLAE